MKKSKILLYSLIIGVIYALFYAYELLKPVEGENWGLVGLQYAFIGIIIIPLIFGILVSLISRQKKLNEFAFAFGISFLTMLILILAVSAWSRAEFRKQYPTTTAPTIQLNSPLRKNLLPN